MLNPYPDCPEGYSEYEFFPEDNEPVRLAQVHGEWLRELTGHFRMVWATGWGEDANRLLCPYFHLPALPVITLPQGPFEPSVKGTAVDAYVDDQAAAWIDDIITEDARRWAENRSHPTLLVEVDPAVGLTRSIVDELIAWAQAIG